jgi:hypothetical protein
MIFSNICRILRLGAILKTQNPQKEKAFLGADFS